MPSIKREWMVGANFVPSTAINQLEMFQNETYDPLTISKELSFASSIGFNAMRVFLHNLLWQNDRAQFLSTLDNFLSIAKSHDIGIIFVLLDSCWNPLPLLGKQPNPVPFVHNSQWVQAPGIKILFDLHYKDKFEADIKSYIQGLLSHFKNDKRIIAWDLWNEPNMGYNPDFIAPLVKQVFIWARETGATQPLTSPVWAWENTKNKDPNLIALESIQIELSDIISFHNYANFGGLRKMVLELEQYGKPLVCTEYMARTIGSTFDPHLGFMKEKNISAFNWGLVTGRTQTNYPWQSLNKPNPYKGIKDPSIWFHDIFYANGTPKFSEEMNYIKSLTSEKPMLSLKYSSQTLINGANSQLQFPYIASIFFTFFLLGIILHYRWRIKGNFIENQKELEEDIDEI